MNIMKCVRIMLTGISHAVQILMRAAMQTQIVYIIIIVMMQESAQSCLDLAMTGLAIAQTDCGMMLIQ